MEKAIPQPETINRLTAAVYPAFAMLAGMQLDLFTPLWDGPLSSGALAASLGVDEDRLSMLLYALVAASLLAEENGCFANTPEASHYLVRGSPAYMGNGINSSPTSGRRCC